MKKIVKRKIGYGLLILLIIVLNSIYFTLINNLGTVDNSLIKISYVCLLGSIVIIIIYLSEFFKNSEKVKNEEIQRFDNLIKFHEKQIDFYKNQIDKINKEYS